MRRAKLRKVAAVVAAVSTSPVACWRSRPQVTTSRGVVRLPSRPRRGPGAATTSAWSWRWRRWPPGPPNPGRPAAPTAPPGDRLLGAGRGGRGPGLAGRPGRSRDRTWRRGGERPAWPVQLHHHLLALSLQEPGQAGAIAAGALDRPHPPTVVSVGEPQQPPVAGRGGRHGQLVDHCAGGCLDDRGGVGVFVGVDPDGRARRGLPAWASR
jgi:hypothetical protein